MREKTKEKVLFRKTNLILLLISMLLWFIPFLFGAFFIIEMYEPGETFETPWDELYKIENKVSLEQAPDSKDPFFYIRTNLKVIGQMLGGSFVFGITTVINTVVEGLVLGIYLGLVIILDIPIKYFVYLVFPHGVFELPALWISGAAGLKGPQVIIRYFRTGKFITRRDLKDFLFLSTYSIILILIAGFIEAKVTYNILEDSL